MHNQFAGYYRPSEEQFSKLWKESIFVFDANTLLNVYRYTSETRESFLDILEKFKNRIWITYQAAYEYQENRLKVISQQMELYDQIEKELKDSSQKLKKFLDGYKRHPLIDIPQLMEIINSSFLKIESYLNEIKANHPDYLTSDDLRDRITQLFDAKVGTPYSDDELEGKYKEAEVRFKRKIPPGYEDSSKDGVRKYGDFIIWSQLLDLAKAQKKPLIFITDDAKEDWWLVHKDKTIGPKPQLIQEMYIRSGNAFYIYKADQFIAHSLKFLELKDQPQVVEEAKEVRRRDQEVNSLARYAQILASGILPEDYQKMLASQSAVSYAMMAQAQSRDYEKLLAVQNPIIDIMAQARDYEKLLAVQNPIIDIMAQARDYEKILAFQRSTISEEILTGEKGLKKPNLAGGEAKRASSLKEPKKEKKASTRKLPRGHANK